MFLPNPSDRVTTSWMRAATNLAFSASAFEVQCHTRLTMTTDTDTQRITATRVGGVSLIVAAIAFMGVFSYLAAIFNYPEVLDGTASEVLPALLATGAAGRAIWAIYALLPLFWIPAAVGAFQALRSKSEGAMHAAVSFAVVSSITMVLGLIRWPSFHWELARAWAADPSLHPILQTIFDSTNSYLGNFIGEFLGELCFSVFFLLSAFSMLKEGSGFARWTGYLGAITGAAGLIGMFRNVTETVAVVAELNNYLLPVWMIVFGVSLLRHRKALSVIEGAPVATAA